MFSKRFPLPTDERGSLSYMPKLNSMLGLWPAHCWCHATVREPIRPPSLKWYFLWVTYASSHSSRCNSTTGQRWMTSWPNISAAGWTRNLPACVVGMATGLYQYEGGTAHIWEETEQHTDAVSRETWDRQPWVPRAPVWTNELMTGCLSSMDESFRNRPEVNGCTPLLSPVGLRAMDGLHLVGTAKMSIHTVFNNIV